MSVSIQLIDRIKHEPTVTMNSKTFATFFVALLAVHASTQTPVKDDSIKPIIVQVFNAVLNVTSTLLVDANKIVSDVDTNRDSIKETLVTEATKLGKAINADIIKIIDLLRDDSTDDGKAVLDCIEGEQSKTDDAIASVIKSVGECAVKEVDVALPEAKTIVGQLQDLQDDVQGQVDTLESCSSAELSCIVSFISTLIDTAKKIPPAIEDDLAAVEEVVKTIIEDVKKCQIFQEIKADAQEIYNEGVVCIKG